MENTCCFIGHSKIWGATALEAALADAVERHITEYGVTEFLAGNYGDFDRMAARTVKKAKAQHPGIHLYLMLPYRPEMGRPLPDREGYDDFVYPEEMEGVPLRLAIPNLNRIMIKDSNYAIVYVIHSWGGAGTSLKYAEQQKRQGKLSILNLGAHDT